MKYKHTPGPWRVERTHDLWLEIRSGEGLQNRMLADCVDERNASLIAAAPELLESLEVLVSLAHAAGFPCDRAEAAIANAKEVKREASFYRAELWLKRIHEAVAEEREACARVCEQGLPIASSLSALDDMEMWGEKFAVAIRARGANE